MQRSPDKSKTRRWFRFRLRTLLVVLTMLSVPLGWVGWELDQRRREKTAIAWIEEMGGNASLEGSDRSTSWEKTKDKWFGVTVLHANLNSTQVSDLSPLTDLNNLEVLNFNSTHVIDLSALTDLSNLEVLNFNSTQVSDLSPLTELKNLKLLFLGNTKVSDLSPLAELKNLTSLFLSNTKVSDLSPLTELKNLTTLFLNGTQVSDLSPLTELKNLEVLNLSFTKISDDQVQELKLALPNIRISID